ncbi:unnamed protein product, partial [Ectocarpus sp. 8 AP-2014]
AVCAVHARLTSEFSSFCFSLVRTGMSILVTDAGSVHHTVVIQVREPHNLYSSCPDDSLSVFLDREENLLAPGTVFPGQDLQASAANLPGACRSFAFEKGRGIWYWERKRLESARYGRSLGTD